ncbi:MAG: helix-turn-helix domain-containing protein [Phycisphaeraceae bacterium]
MSGVGLQLLRCGYFNAVPAHFMHRPRAEDYLFIWVIGGKGFAETEGRREDVTTGTLLTFAKGEAHTYGSDPHDPWHVVWFHFDGPAAADVLADVRRAGGAASWAPLSLDDQLRERWMELIAAHHARQPHHCRLADYLLWGVLGLIRQRLELRAAGQPAASWQIVHAVQRYVREHLSEPIAVEDLARVAHVSCRQLTRLIQEAIGCAPMAYVLDQRIAQAADMLRQTEQPVKQIARAVGYDDPYYFTRLFKRRTGQSPTAYRHGGR